MKGEPDVVCKYCDKHVPAKDAHVTAQGYFFCGSECQELHHIYGKVDENIGMLSGPSSFNLCRCVVSISIGLGFVSLLFF